MIISCYDLTGIQKYVFGSNALQDNLGASHLADQALSAFLKETCPGGCKVDWAGGGNAVTISPDWPMALEWTSRFHLRLLDRAPGLSYAVAHVEWDGSEADYGTAHGKAMEQLVAVKAGRWEDAHFTGAGVTEACATTGEPATESDGEQRWIGPATRAKRAAVDEANERLRKCHNLGKDYAYTNVFDELGRSLGDRSMLGVIHLDGNGMGERFRQTARGPNPSKALRELSAAVERAGRATLSDGLAWIERSIPALTDPDQGGLNLMIKREPHVVRAMFPVRPIVFGGDDITLVCDGRIAIDLAAALLRAWVARSSEHLPGSGSHACAGVALVNVRFPFYRAYGLAEELCQGAKKELQLRGMSDQASLLDFELYSGGPLRSVEELRQRDTAADGARLTSRPYYVVGQPPNTAPHRAWAWFRLALVAQLQQDPRWMEFHSQLKGLAPSLHQGRDATRIHLARWRDRFQAKLPEPDGFPLATQGFVPGSSKLLETPYLDALDLLDRIVPFDCFAAAGGA